MQGIGEEREQLWEPMRRALCFLDGFVYFDTFTVTSENTCTVLSIQSRSSTLPYRMNPKQGGNEANFL